MLYEVIIMNLKITEEKALVSFDAEFSIVELREVKDIIKALNKYKANIVAITIIDPDENIKDDKMALILCKKL